MDLHKNVFNCVLKISSEGISRKSSCSYLQHPSERQIVMFAGYYSTCTSNSYIMLHYGSTYLVGQKH